MQYQRKTQETEAQLLATQRAFHQLRVSSQPHPPRQSVLRQAVTQPSPIQSTAGLYHSPAVGSLPTVVHHVQGGYENVMGADGRRYMVPSDQLSHIPDFEIVTGPDGRQYKVAKSQLSLVQSAQQQNTPQPSSQYPTCLGDDGAAYPWHSNGAHLI